MASHLDYLVLLSSCAIQFAAALWAIRIIPQTQVSAAWMLMAAAFSLMGLRRGLAAYAVVVLGNPAPPLHEEAVALAISLCCALGVLLIAERFRRADEGKQALEASERRFQSILEASPTGILVCQMNGTVLLMNPAACEMFGYDQGFQPGNRELNYIDLLVDEEHARFEESGRFKLPRGRKGRNRYRCVRRDGSEFPAEISRAILSRSGKDTDLLAVSVVDLTEINSVMARLERERHFATRLIETSPVYYAALDKQGAITMVNEALLSGTGHTSNELLGRSFLEMFVQSPERRRRLREDYHEFLQQSAAAGLTEPMLTKDGRTLTVEWHARTVHDETGEVDFAFGLGIDITERMKLEAEQQTYRAELETLNESLQQRNQELDEFTFVASHDLQEPVRKQQMFVDFLRGLLSSEVSEDVHFALQALDSSAQRMQRLVQDLLALSRSARRVLRIESTPLDHCLDDSLELLSQCIEERGEVRIRREPLPTIEADALLITQVFQNLIGNAIKFNDKDEVEIGIHAQHVDGLWEIRVQDNGIGMSAEAAKHIFAPFKRLHSRNDYDGSGIGLAICQKVVERHGGHVTVSSTPGEGTVFTLHLPERQPHENAPTTSLPVTHQASA